MIQKKFIDYYVYNSKVLVNCKSIVFCKYGNNLGKKYINCNGIVQKINN